MWNSFAYRKIILHEQRRSLRSINSEANFKLSVPFNMFVLYGGISPQFEYWLKVNFILRFQKPGSESYDGANLGDPIERCSPLIVDTGLR